MKIRHLEKKREMIILYNTVSPTNVSYRKGKKMELKLF